ncbi:MAG: hypothetical protein KA807_14355 [Prolixibacteraceae bacterium]|nr:hypothetical protein [Prolixibacteraceae bacterium]
MGNLFDKWKTQVPKYSEEFRKLLFDPLSKKGGGSEKSKVDLGKHFSNNYELYMYAFFLGLYEDEYIPIPETSKKDDFGHPIQFWGSKAGRLERTDFTILQEYMFIALIAKTSLDLLALEKGEVSEKDAIKELLQTMEAYTNGGLTLIKEKLDENQNFFLQPTVFLNMILDSKIKSEKQK